MSSFMLQCHVSQFQLRMLSDNVFEFSSEFLEIEFGSLRNSATKRTCNSSENGKHVWNVAPGGAGQSTAQIHWTWPAFGGAPAGMTYEIHDAGHNVIVGNIPSATPQGDEFGLTEKLEELRKQPDENGIGGIPS